MASSPGAIVPAQLGFLAVFNPSLGNTDETIDDQIVYYSSVTTQFHRRRHRFKGRPTDHVSQEERNERLRQIGLAQGMVEFGKSFSGGKAVDTIETERSRVILHELESGWWILASIDLTRIPLPPKLSTSKSSDRAEEVVEYSSKEIKPAPLLLQDLLRAHAIFLLHHDSSLSGLFVRTRRSKFVSIMTRYWDLFLSTWNVMVHGNPARNVFGGINIAGSGELGMGVGEEDRGSGEREVLEGLVGRIEGLVDLVVSKYGSHETGPEGKAPESSAQSWLGTGQDPGAEDGAIFLGTGAISRKSVRDVAHWMEDLYCWGENAYGVIESPTSLRQARRVKRAASDRKTFAGLAAGSKHEPTGAGSRRSTKSLAERRGQPITSADGDTPAPSTSADGDRHMDKFVSYLKMGYGTYWSLGQATESGSGEGSQTSPDVGGIPATSKEPAKQLPSKVDDAAGHYLIGLMGDVEESGTSGADDNGGPEEVAEAEHNSRTMVRTLHIEIETTEEGGRPEASIVKDLGRYVNEVTPLVGDPIFIHTEFENQDQNKAKKLRVVVYVNKPFIFTFLFELRTDSLAWDAMYRSLHYQLAPLRKPLLASTMYRPERPDAGAAAASIYDLIWDPATMTVHSTIPNIPDPAVFHQPNAPIAWSRIEAMNTHMQLLNIFAMTRPDITELERTCKTNRGWWVVWTRILDRHLPTRTPEEEQDDEQSDFLAARDESDTDGTPTERGRNNLSLPPPTVTKEIFLIRQASDHAGFRGVSSSFTDGGGSWADGPGRLAQGIGVDTRKYIEGLLSLSR